jgi:spermidine synthase
MADGEVKYFHKLNNRRISKKDFRSLMIKETDDALMCGDRHLVLKYEKKILKKGIRLLCKKHNPKSVLEVGFGLGYTAQEFQDCGIDRHTIIEPHPVIYAKAVQWANQFPNKYIKVIEKFFQDYETDERYDIVYDDRMDMVYHNDEFIRSDETLREWLKSYCKEDGIVAGFAREKHHPIRSFDNGFFFNLDGTEYRQPLMVNK